MKGVNVVEMVMLVLVFILAVAINTLESRVKELEMKVGLEGGPCVIQYHQYLTGRHALWSNGDRAIRLRRQGDKTWQPNPQ